MTFIYSCHVWRSHEIILFESSGIIIAKLSLFWMGPAFPYTMPVDVISIESDVILCVWKPLNHVCVELLLYSTYHRSKAVGILGSSTLHMSLNYILAGCSHSEQQIHQLRSCPNRVDHRTCLKPAHKNLLHPLGTPSSKSQVACSLPAGAHVALASGAVGFGHRRRKARLRCRSKPWDDLASLGTTVT